MHVSMSLVVTQKGVEGASTVTVLCQPPISQLHLCTPWLDFRPQVGFMAATTQVDVPLLHRSFDLYSYDGLLHPEMYDVQEAHARMLATRKVTFKSK